MDKSWKNNNTLLRESRERWIDSGYCTSSEWPDLKSELEEHWRRKYKDATAKLVKTDTRGLRMYVVVTEEE